MRRRAAFTLVELLVSMVVGVLLITFLFQLFNATANAWRSGEEQTDTFREARAALQMMVRDIGSTTAPLTRNAYASPTPAPSPSPAPGLAPVLVMAPFGNPDPVNEELYCLANVPNNGASSLCAVGYFCAWMPDLVASGDPGAAKAPHAYALMRQFLGSGRPAVIADAAKGTTARAAVPGLFDIFRNAASGPLAFTDVYARVIPPAVADPGQPVATAAVLCSYIWDLQFRSSKTLKSSPTPAPFGAATPYAAESKDLPAYVEVRFKALSATAARQLEGNTAVLPSTWNDNQNATSIYQRIIQPGTRQFVARVPLGIGSDNSTPVP